MADTTIDASLAEALGVSAEAYAEVVAILGHLPTEDELSTLLAMWDSNGRQQSLYGWLKGQRHAVELNNYLYSGSSDHLSIQEPRIKECLDVARSLCRASVVAPCGNVLSTGRLLYMVGNVSTEFADSEYARRCLHIVSGGNSDTPLAIDESYVSMIADALDAAGLVLCQAPVATGGLFCSLLGLTAPLGFDILCPREVRLDAFLFGEEAGRRLVAVDEQQDDLFLSKLVEARLNCCFLGRTTKNRIVVDGFDFGLVDDFVA